MGSDHWQRIVVVRRKCLSQFDLAGASRHYLSQGGLLSDQPSPGQPTPTTSSTIRTSVLTRRANELSTILNLRWWFMSGWAIACVAAADENETPRNDVCKRSGALAA